jgi:hypothetical protein
MLVTHEETAEVRTEPYEPPTVEQVLTAEDLHREVIYAGPGTFPDDTLT